MQDKDFIKDPQPAPGAVKFNSENEIQEMLLSTCSPVLSYTSLDLFLKRDTTQTMKLYFDLTQFEGPLSDQTNKNTMNTVQSMGNSGSRRGLTKERSTLDILEVFKVLTNSLTNIRPIYLKVVRILEALSVFDPFYPGITQAFDTIDQISPRQHESKISNE